MVKRNSKLSCLSIMFVVVEFNCWYCTSLQFNDQLESARELETQQAQLRGQIQEAQKHVSII